MKVLVTGNPRSGTMSMARTLQSVGLDVKHEVCGADGTVSCFFFLRPIGDNYPRERTTQWRHLGDVFDPDAFEHKFIVVRNPLKCIPSMAKIVGLGHRQWLADNGIVDFDLKQFGGKLAWSAHAWLRTNRYILDNLTQEVIRIEHALDDWPSALPRPGRVLHRHKASGNRKSEPLTKSGLKALVPSIYSDIISMARDLGYNL